MITPNGIRYTWKQIFNRLGIKAETDHFFLGGHKIIFHYGQPEVIDDNDNDYHLVIQPGEPEGLDSICDDPDYTVTRLPGYRRTNSCHAPQPHFRSKSFLFYFGERQPRRTKWLKSSMTARC